MSERVNQGRGFVLNYYVDATIVDSLRFSFARLSLSHGERYVRSVEVRDQDLWRVHSQAACDVRLNGWGGCRRQGEDRWSAHLGNRVDQPQIFGAELLTPLADQVRLIDDEQPDV